MSQFLIIGGQSIGTSASASILPMNVCECVKSLSRVQLFATPRTVAYQAPPSMGFSRQEYWSGLPFPSPIFRVNFLYDWQVWSPCCSRNAQESFPAPQLKGSILQCSTIFMAYLPHLYMTPGKNIALIRWTCVSKVMSLPLYTLSRVSHSFPSKKQASFNFVAEVIIHSDFGAQENKVCQYLHCFPIYLPWSDGTGCYGLNFLNVDF